MGELDALREENAGLHRAIGLLHEISVLVRSAQELAPTCYALLTGVTAGVGLGMHRAAIFLGEPGGPLVGMAGVGPSDEAEADRVWREIAAERPDLQTLYEAGLARRANPGRFDQRVKGLEVDPRGGSPIAMALRRGKLVHAEGEDDLDGLLHLPSVLAAPLRGQRPPR